jgi:hypothetical protein
MGGDACDASPTLTYASSNAQVYMSKSKSMMVHHPRFSNVGWCITYINTPLVRVGGYAILASHHAVMHEFHSPSSFFYETNFRMHHYNPPLVGNASLTLIAAAAVPVMHHYAVMHKFHSPSLFL